MGTRKKRASEALLTSTYNICFCGKVKKITPELLPNTPPSVPCCLHAIALLYHIKRRTLKSIVLSCVVYLCCLLLRSLMLALYHSDLFLLNIKLVVVIKSVELFVPYLLNITKTRLFKYIEHFTAKN